jgi:16S rRNA C967 or C1407 C5-methylase (RsmB/RsmF family)/NOL1/NOP2/fmu family ribosome biogenesis protein
MFPLSFSQRMAAMLAAEAPAFEAALKGVAPVSVRMNRAKAPAALPAPVAGEVPWAEEGRYLVERPVFTLDPALHAGAYYVQEASSMFLAHALRGILAEQVEPVVALDLCAAPGGKSTHLYDLLPEGSLLIANEVIRPRAEVLAENLTKWGAMRVAVTNADPEVIGKRLEGICDLMVVDAPCSGEGMFRKDPDSVKEWSEDHVRLCADRQKRILADAWAALKPGGWLVYSTCTYNIQENEENLAWMRLSLGAETLQLQPNADWGVVETQHAGMYGYRLYPHRLSGEGLFLGVVQKPAVGERASSNLRKRKPGAGKLPQATRKEAELVRPWLRPEAEAAFWKHGDLLHAFPQDWAHLVPVLDALPLKKLGTVVGSLHNRGVNPEHELALSPYLDPEAFAVAETAREEAINFLSLRDFTPEEVGTGWNLIRHGQHALGWAKPVGNRMNNYYPKHWRIRMGG